MTTKPKGVFLGLRIPAQKKSLFLEVLKREGKSATEIFDNAINRVIANSVVRDEK